MKVSGLSLDFYYKATSHQAGLPVLQLENVFKPELT